ncbi:MAG: LytR/AlgR family response regulator transcription factor [Nocardioidaceae bacterium]
MGASPLNVLVVDDELPPREELGFLLSRDDRIGEITTTGSGADALRRLEHGGFDAVFLDIAMPGLDGLDVARLLAQFKAPPSIVFLTAHEEYAVEAFDVHAVDYLLKPVREERLFEAVRRVVESRGQSDDASFDDTTIPVELGGVTRFVHRSEVLYVESQGDYARLHTSSDSHLVRVPLAVLEKQWKDAGFTRIHRQLLVCLGHVSEVRFESGRCSVLVGDRVLAVSRRHTRELRDLLVRRARPGASS